jgi:hypothetical protein
MRCFAVAMIAETRFRTLPTSLAGILVMQTLCQLSLGIALRF